MGVFAERGVGEGGVAQVLGAAGGCGFVTSWDTQAGG